MDNQDEGKKIAARIAEEKAKLEEWTSNNILTRADTKAFQDKWVSFRSDATSHIEDYAIKALALDDANNSVSDTLTWGHGIKVPPINFSHIDKCLKLHLEYALLELLFDGDDLVHVKDKLLEITFHTNGKLKGKNNLQSLLTDLTAKAS